MYGVAVVMTPYVFVVTSFIGFKLRTGTALTNHNGQALVTTALRALPHKCALTSNLDLPHYCPPLDRARLLLR